MSLTDHLEELRRRLVASAIAYFVGIVVSYAFSTDLFKLLKLPLARILHDHPGSTFAIRSISEGFMVELKVAMIAGVFVACPVIFYQIWKFVAPGLYEHEKRLALPVVTAASLLFCVGAFFGYFVIFPAAFEFLMSYAVADTAAVLSIDEYLDFAAKMLAGFGIVFELPLVIFMISWLGIVNHHQLRAWRRYVIVGIFVLAALITPPEVISQLGVAVPMVLLYEVGIGVSWLVGRKRRTDAELAAENAARDG